MASYDHSATITSGTIQDLRIRAPSRHAAHLPEWFVLYRNDAPYASREKKEPLEQIVLSNPDFTEPQGGMLPTWEIVRYVADPYHQVDIAP